MWVRLGWAGLLLLLVACGGASGTSVARQTIDGVTIALERPASIAVLQDYDVVVGLSDAAGAPIEGALVFLEQDMPAMPMSSNQPLGEPIGNGRYRIKAVFTMDGRWVVKVHATIAGKDYVAAFDQDVALPQ